MAGSPLDKNKQFDEDFLLNIPCNGNPLNCLMLPSQFTLKLWQHRTDGLLRDVVDALSDSPRLGRDKNATFERPAIAECVQMINQLHHSNQEEKLALKAAFPFKGSSRLVFNIRHLI